MLHQFKIRQILVVEGLIKPGWYVTCSSCDWVHTKPVSTYESAQELGQKHQAIMEGVRLRAKWRATRFNPPVWEASKQGRWHAMIAQRHHQQHPLLNRTMCGGQLASGPIPVPSTICLRCIAKYNRWLQYVVKLVQPTIQTKLQKQLAAAMTVAEECRRNEKVAIATNANLVQTIAGAQNEINALRHYIKFAVDKLYAEHHTAPPTPPEILIDISLREV